MRTAPATTLLALCCALAAGACGSSSAPRQTGGSPASPIAFADCMRSHGVPDLPDPMEAGGIAIPSGSAINPSSPAFKAAQARCAKLLAPGRTPVTGERAAEVRAEMLAMSKCMRAHGVSGFPDPTLSPPADPAADSFAMGHYGVFLAVPLAININSPAFEHAASVCRFGPGSGRTQAAPPG